MFEYQEQELIISGRQTGKASFLLQSGLSQKEKPKSYEFTTSSYVDTMGIFNEQLSRENPVCVINIDNTNFAVGIYRPFLESRMGAVLGMYRQFDKFYQKLVGKRSIRDELNYLSRLKPKHQGFEENVIVTSPNIKS